MMETSNEELSTEVYLDAIYSNLTTQNVGEKYILGMSTIQQEEELSYEYTLDTNKKFSNDIQIEGFTSENSFVLNDASQDQTDRLMQGLAFKIGEVNRNQMNSLGLSEEQNPLIYATPIGMTVVIFYDNMNSVINDVNERNNALIEKENELAQEALNQIDSITQSMSDDSTNNSELNSRVDM